jgi:DNA-binding MarR family transcriptional regulator
MEEQLNQLDVQRIAQLGASCPLRHLRMATRVATQLYDEVLKPTGLRSTQVSVLVAATLLEPVTITRLAEVLVMDRTTLTRNLKPLEREGLVRVAPGDDQRTREVTLTSRGKEMVAKAVPQWEEAQARVVGELGEKWRHDLLENLSALVSLSREI